MMIAIAGIASAAVLVLLSAIHIYWAFGGEWATTATVPTVDGKPRITPSTAATLAVALLLALAAGLVGGSVFEFGPRPLFRVGSAGVSAVLFSRAIGGRGYVGFFKRVRGTPFASRDTFVYSPLCLLLCAGTLAVAIAS